MNATCDVPEISTTSSGSAMASTVLAVAYAICAPSVVPVTSAEGAVWRPSRDGVEWRTLEPTTSGTEPTTRGLDAEVPEAGGRTGIAELRRVSGLTWDQLARVLGVARRSLHFWASGKPMLPANEERLHRVLATIRTIDRGDAAENRRILLRADRGGVIALDLLAAGRVDEVIRLVGTVAAPRAPVAVAISDRARARRRPQPLVDRAATTDEIAHRDRGTPRRVRVVRRK